MSLEQFAPKGRYLMLALDHRGSFKKLMNPDSPESVSDAEAVAMKHGIISSLKDQFTGVLIDKEFGLPAYRERTKPFLLPIEKTGYTEQTGERITELEESAASIKAKGANGVKLLLYFNPSYESAKKQLETAKRVVEDCRFNEMPLFLEIVAYGEGANDKVDLVVPSLEKFLQADIRPDVYKLGYPGSEQKSAEVTKMLGDLPWIMLTAGENYQTFVSQLSEAAKGGAKGFLAGRGIWQEACTLEGQAKEDFFKTVLPQRFKEITQIVTGE